MNKLQETEKKYVTFDDLNFREKYPAQPDLYMSSCEQARIDFENGWGVSVLRGDSYTGGAAFEIAVMKNGEISYESEITNDVKRFDSISELNDCLRDIQNLDENGVVQRPKEKNREEIKMHIERRKAQIKKARNLRKQIEKRNPMEKFSGVVLADEIAKDKISGREKRTITPEVGMAIRYEKALEK